MPESRIAATVTPEHDSDRLITIGEFATRVRVAVRTLQNRRATNPDSLPQAFKIGGRLLFRESEVLAWIEQQRA